MRKDLPLTNGYCIQSMMLVKSKIRRVAVLFRHGSTLRSDFPLVPKLELDMAFRFHTQAQAERRDSPHGAVALLLF